MENFTLSEFAQTAITITNLYGEDACEKFIESVLNKYRSTLCHD